MCGIVGVTGEGGEVDASAIVLEGLRRLEYRGYDSAGIALVIDGPEPTVELRRVAEGTHSVDLLAKVLEEERDELSGHGVGIGHTRWATHGRPTAENAHPHLDCTGRLALVHNGIIDDHLVLGLRLTEEGHTLKSETDSEVLVHLIEAERASGRSLPDALREVLAHVEGAFAIAVIDAGDPTTIVAARRAAPLVIGCKGTITYLASDIPALVGRTDTFLALEDDEIAVLRPGSCSITTIDGRPVERRSFVIDWDIESAEKGGWDDFMMKEMHEQPSALHDTLLDRHDPSGQLMLDEASFDMAVLDEVERIVIVACGSAYHAGLVGSRAIEQLVGIPTEVEIASEFRFRPPVHDHRTLTIAISQSGETLDTLQALRAARSRGSTILVVTNVVGSSLAREADGVFYTRAGPEVAVASTKCHLAQILALEIVALMLARRRHSTPDERVEEILTLMGTLPELVEAGLDRAPEVDRIASELLGARDFFYLGRGFGYPVALEGALKLKEISYLRAEGYPAGELKHGPIALIDDEAVVIGVLAQDETREKLLANLAEVKSRGATVVVVASDDDVDAAAHADHVLSVPATDPLLAPFVMVLPLQLLAYRMARLLGNDVDRPRNLAKTVTVE